MVARRLDLRALERARWLALQVDGIESAGWAARAEEALCREPGVFTVQVESHGRVIVTFDPAVVGVGRLADVVAWVEDPAHPESGAQLTTMRTGAVPSGSEVTRRGRAERVVGAR